jgi:hypothetical protein
VGLHLRESDVGGVGGDDDADHGEFVLAVRAAVNAVGCGNAVRRWNVVANVAMFGAVVAGVPVGDAATR